MLSRTRRGLAAAGLLVAAATGCNKEAPKPSAKEAGGAADAGAAKGGVADPKLVAALEQLEAKEPSTAQAGPPPNGVLGAARANAEAPSDQPPTVVLGEKGTAPLRLLAPPLPKAGAKATWTVTLTQAQQGGMSLPLVLTLALKAGAPQASASPKPESAKPEPAKPEPAKPEAAKAEAAKAEAAKAEAMKADAAKALANTVVPIVATVTQVGGAPGAALPQELLDAVAGLKGATISWSVGAAGLVDPPRYAAGAKGTPLDADLGNALVAELNGVLLRFPTVEVGAGATWMITARTDDTGFDTVTYRMVRALEVTPEGATLSVATRRYSASDGVPMGGLPETTRLAAFEFNGEAKVVLRASQWLPASGQASDTLQALVVDQAAAAPAGQPPRQMMMVSRTSMQFE